MAGKQSTTFPSIPVSHWWTLRNKFKAKMPAAVSADYVAVTLNMAESSAKANVLPALYAFRIIDHEGKPLDRALKWRDDEQYSILCQELLQETYPQQLIDAFPGPEIDRVAVERWFSINTGVGERAAKKMALVFDLLSKGDPNEGDIVLVRGPRRRQKRSHPPRPTTFSGSYYPLTTNSRFEVERGASPAQTESTPPIEINVQIHIATDTSSEQIDAIFASIARHLRRR